MSKKKKKKKYSSIVDSVLANTPGQQSVMPTFDEYYASHPELAQEDLAQAQNQVNPSIAKDVANELEDLTLYTQSSTADYNRSLRRARATMAVQGGAIGSERTTVEGEMAADKQAADKTAQKGTALKVGTGAMNAAGFNDYTTPQEGSLPASQKAQVADWQQWYKTNRANTYWSGANTYYKQPSGNMLK